MGLNIRYISEQSRLYSDPTIKEMHFDDLLRWLSTIAASCLDTEGTGLNPHSSKVTLIQIGNKDIQWIVDGNHPRIPELKPFLESSDNIKMGANLSYDYKMLQSNYDIRAEKFYDVSRVDEVLFNGLFSDLHSNAEKAKGMYLKAFSLHGLCLRHLGFDISKRERGAFLHVKNVNDYTNEMLRYAARDVVYPELIRDKQIPLTKKYNLEECVKLENNVIQAISDMEYNGISLDVPGWTKHATDNEKRAIEFEEKLDTIILDKLGLSRFKLDGIQADLFSDAPTTHRRSRVNWRSPDGVLEVIKEMGFNVESTSKRSIQSALAGIELGEEILKAREVFKATDSYGFKFLEYVDPVTKRVHPNYNQLYPDTGRLSCERPNLQNIKSGTVYRSSFIAGDGKDLTTHDYSGAELRLMAAISGDPVWLEALRKNEDLHGKLAMENFKITEKQLKSQPDFIPTETTYRAVQKTIDFLVPYGGGADKIAEQFKIPIAKAQSIVDNFFKTCPKVKTYLDNAGKFGKKYGYARTFAPIGRIRWFREHADALKADDYTRNKILSDIERASMNLPIQGACADIVKLAMLNTRNYIKEHDLWKKVKMLLQVHDELVDEVDQEFSKEWAEIKRDIMLKSGEQIVTNVPMEVSVSIDTKWSK